MASYANVVYFAHGKLGTPWGTKIQSLAQIARSKGFHVESPDYSQTTDPDKRVEILLNLQPAAQENLVLVGSSMGSYASTVASEKLKPRGLFLLASAFYLPGYAEQDPTPVAELTTLIHGWQDPIVPVENALRFARQHQTQCHLLNSAHRLTDVLPTIERLFELFLDQALTAPKA